jgi:hypothetical protein
MYHEFRDSRIHERYLAAVLSPPCSPNGPRVKRQIDPSPIPVKFRLSLPR